MILLSFRSACVFFCRKSQGTRPGCYTETPLLGELSALFLRSADQSVAATDGLPSLFLIGTQTMHALKASIQSIHVDGDEVLKAKDDPSLKQVATRSGRNGQCALFFQPPEGSFFVPQSLSLLLEYCECSSHC
jgi:hypothetical protein